MAKFRVINTRFWIDDYISNLDPVEKLLFLYIITNPSTEICGIYELPVKIMAVETGIEKDMVLKILKRFQKDKKIFFKDGWVMVKNFAKHQISNPSVKIGIEKSFDKIPLKIREYFDIIQTDPSLGGDYRELESESESELKSKPKEAETSSAGIVSIIDSFKEINSSYKKWYGNTTQRGACQRLIDTHGLDRVLSVITFLQKSNNIPYLPVITTPLQLEDKWSALEAGVRKKQGELSNNKIAFK